VGGWGAQVVGIRIRNRRLRDGCRGRSQRASRNAGAEGGRCPNLRLLGCGQGFGSRAGDSRRRRTRGKKVARAGRGGRAHHLRAAARGDEWMTKRGLRLESALGVPDQAFGDD
jgi:hypothetical protein